MKNKKIKLILLLVLLLCIAITYIAYAQPGTENDPVVTLSYIKNIFKPEVKAEIQNETNFRIVNVKKGEFIYGSEGSEFILRSGSAYVVSTKSGGLANVTAGYDATNDTPVNVNNLYIIPRDDGRGFWAAADCILMVKGSYRIS